jgi:hypothetical protein
MDLSKVIERMKDSAILLRSSFSIIVNG